MVKTLVVIFLFICILVSQKDVSAHSRGVPILKINGALTKVYPIQLSAIEPSLGEDSDIASENYIVNQKLDFDFEASNSSDLQFVDDLKKITYVWNFGDGTDEKRTSDNKNSHTYTKSGSFVMKISADLSKATGDDYVQIVQTTLVHILPNKDYKLPQPVIKINDQIVSADKLILANSPPTSVDGLFARVESKKTLALDFNKRLKFDASQSNSSSSRIVQYVWDLGQGDSSKNRVASIKYKLPQYFITAVLGVKDENGFIAEAAVDLNNSGKNEPSSFSVEDFISPVVLIIGAQLIALVIGLFWYIKRKKSKSSNS